MQMPSIRFHFQSLKLKQNLKCPNLNGSIKGIFESLKQRQSLIHRFKKGNLTQLSNQIKSQENNAPIDPFIKWLEQNSQDKNFHKQSQKKIQNQQKLVKEGFKSKQKNSVKNKLPKIQLFGKTQNKSFLKKLPKIRGANLQQGQDKSQWNFNSKLNKSQISKNSDSNLNLKRTQSQFLKCSEENTLQNHKNNCFRNSLSNTQLSGKKQDLLLQEIQQKNIRNNFYLNDHKKMMSTSTFFMKSKPKAQIDYDLQRLKGFSKSSGRSFEENLQHIGKKTSLTCYNQLSQNFLSMKKQIQNLILEHLKGDVNKKQKKIERKGSLILKQNKLSDRIKTQSSQYEIEDDQDNRGYLPNFLMKSLIMPSRTSNSQHIECKKVQNLRT